MTPEGIDPEDEEGVQRRIVKENFTFKMVNIPDKAILEFTEDTDKTCTVAGTKAEVEYDGNIYSITGLTKELKQVEYGVQATRYWRYEGETLQARRERLEEKARVQRCIASFTQQRHT